MIKSNNSSDLSLQDTNVLSLDSKILSNRFEIKYKKI